MPWLLVAAVALVVAVVAVVLIRGSGSHAGGDRTITMAAVLPLSGNTAAIGTPKREAIQLALDEIGRSHPKLSLNVAFEDSRGTPRDGVSAFSKVIATNGVKLAFVDMTTIVNACTPIADSNRVLMFAGSAEAGITDRSAFVYRVFPGGDQEVELITKHLLSLPPPQKLFLLHTNEFYGHSVRDLIKKRLSGTAIEILGAEEYALADSDFRAQLSKAKASGATRLLLLGYGMEYTRILKQAQELGISASQVVSNLGAVNATVTALPTELTEGMVFAGPAFNLRLEKLDSYPKQKAMVEAYKARFGKEPDFRVAFVYDTMMLIAKALEEAGGTEGLPAVLARTPSFEGVSGRISLPPNRDAVVDMVLARYEGGNVVALEPAP
jgi:branched-chain amino acid transport system substrate-binding protein